MADHSEYRTDRAIPEYDQMRSLKLFSDEEILKIKKTRENFQYKISQPSRVIKDYVECIKYERGLMGTTRERIKQNKVTANHTILTLIADRMKQLYAQALSKFTQNIRFWDEYIKFLQTFKYTKDISSTFDRMLQFHSDKPEVWIRAILWEYNENFNDERVKSLLLRAQQRHPESQKLYLTFFQIELENKRHSEELEALQHADIVYTSSKKKFTNVEFFIEMLNIVDKFSYASSIQQNILDDMREMFPREEIMWHTLAQRELHGLSAIDCTVDFTGLIKSEGVENKNEDSKLNLNLKKLKIEDLAAPATHTLRKRIELSTQIYEEAVKVIDTAKMWNYYINAMLDLNSDLSTQSSMKRFCLKRAFEGAHQSNHMSEDHYLQYIELLYGNNPKDDTIEKVLQRATKVYESSLRIWLLCLRYYIQENNFKKVQEIFKIAKGVLGAKGAELWQLYVMYVKSCRSSEAHAEFDRYIMELSRQQHASFNNLKAQILELLAATTNMKRARKTYTLFIKHYPACYEVHEMMAELEAKQMIRDPEAERYCMEMLILNFGKTRTDVWLRYMRFERFAGEPKNVSKLHKSALATLKPELLDDFSALYNFFSNGVV